MAKGALAGIGVGIGIGTAFEGIKSMIAGASDWTENVGKIKASFGDTAASVIADSNAMAKAFGTSKNEYLDAAGKLGAIFKGAGFGGQELADLSQRWVRLAYDASSYNNIDFGEAFQKLRAGLTGEAEPLKDLGILMNEGAVKAQALKMGLVGVGQELSEQVKVQARAALMAEGLKDAIGDMARTSKEHAGTMRRFWGSLNNLGTELGAAFLPAVTKVVSITADLIGGISEFASKTGLVSGLTAAFNLVVEPLEVITSMIKGAIDLMAQWGITAENLAAVFKDVSSAFSAVGSLFNPVEGIKDALGFGGKSKDSAPPGEMTEARARAKADKLIKDRLAKDKPAAGSIGLPDMRPAMPEKLSPYAPLARQGTAEAYHAIIEAMERWKGVPWAGDEAHQRAAAGGKLTFADSRRADATAAKTAAQQAVLQTELLRQILRKLPGGEVGAILAGI